MYEIHAVGASAKAEVIWRNKRIADSGVWRLRICDDIGKKMRSPRVASVRLTASHGIDQTRAPV